jgi:hypothetical protein
MVWAGDRLVVWSGSKPSTTDGERLMDGALWGPNTGWRELAPPPDADALVPGGFALWTGREVVLGPVSSAGAHARQQSGEGSSLLAYRPASNSWRRIVPDGAAAEALGDPTARFSGVASLIGDEILVGRTGGGSGAGREPGRLVALDPATGASRVLDPGPFDASPYPDLSGEVLVTVAGENLLAAPNWAAEAWLLDPSGSGTWTPTAPPPIADLHLHGSAWAEGEALFLANHPPAAYEVASDRWRSLTPPRPDRSWARLDGVDAMRRAGDRILLVEGMYDPAADAWHALPRLPVPEQEVRIGAFVDWTGDAVVVFGGGSYTCPVDAICEIEPTQADWTQEGWIYRP